MRNHPYPRADGVRSIAFGIIFSILTCGIYSLYWQYKQMVTLNGWLGRDRLSFLALVFSEYPDVRYLCILLRVQNGGRNQ